MNIDGFEPVPSSGVPARDSATIIVARDRAEGPELFMLERHLDSDFAGGAYVFPGGALDDADADPALADLVDGWRELAADMGETDDDSARALIVCAIRETFEEAGVLLARTEDGDPVVLDDPIWDDRRRAIDMGEMTPAVLAKEAGIRYAADGLRFWQRWATPEYAPKRYDTRFFVALMPEGQTPLHDDRETVGSIWITPHAALERAKGDDFPIIFPTRKTLETVEPFDSVDALKRAAVGRPNECVTPVLYIRGEEVKIQVEPGGDLQDPW